MKRRQSAVVRPCLAEPLEDRLLMALAKAQGGSGVSANLSSNATIKKQQLLVDPNSPASGSTSVSYDPTLVTLTGITPGPGYDNENFQAYVEVTPFPNTDTIFSDQTFNNSDWTQTSRSVDGEGSASAMQDSIGGNAGPYREIDMDIPIPNDSDEGQTTVVSTNLKTNAVYNPAVSGKIGHIDYSEDSLALSEFSQDVGVVAEQDGQYYYSYVSGTDTEGGGWENNTSTGLTANDFYDYNTYFVGGEDAPVLHPDFSANGDPITFGFYRAGFSHDAAEIDGGIDNWSVDISPNDPPPPSEIPEGVLGGSGMMLSSHPGGSLITNIAPPPSNTIFQPINDFLEDPAGTETGYVQFFFTHTPDTSTGLLTPPEGFTPVDSSGPGDDVDTAGLMFDLLPTTSTTTNIHYTAFAAHAGSHGSNSDDFFTTDDGTYIGPDQISSASVNSDLAPIISSTGGPYTINEGSGVTLHGSASDPDGDPTALTYSWDLNGDNVIDATGANPTVSAAKLQSLGLGDGPKMSNITLTVSDGVKSVASNDTLQINNVKPVAQIKSVNAPLAGPITISVGATDASTADKSAGFNYLIDWGDGSAVQTVNRTANNGNGVNVTHNYANIGNYTISVKAVDKDGGTSDAVTTPVIASGAQLLPDPSNTSKKALFVMGTNNDDFIRFVSTRNGEQVFDFLKNLGTFSNFTRVIAYGNGGNDDIALWDAPGVIFGGDGNDILLQGASTGVLDGGAGSDFLYGGSGQDILIGGTGSDLLAGGNAADILISGRTSFDNGTSADVAALTLMLNEWTRTNATYAAKIAHLTGAQSGGLNGSAIFQTSGPSQNVFDDNAVDILLGGGGQDWMILHKTGSGAKDISDLAGNETGTNV